MLVLYSPGGQVKNDESMWLGVYNVSRSSKGTRFTCGVLNSNRIVLDDYQLEPGDTGYSRFQCEDGSTTTVKLFDDEERASEWVRNNLNELLKHENKVWVRAYCTEQTVTSLGESSPGSSQLSTMVFTESAPSDKAEIMPTRLSKRLALTQEQRKWL